MAEQAAGGRHPGRFAVLLGALVLLMVLLPFLTTAVGAVRFRLLVTGVLLAGTYAMSRSRRVLMVGLALGITALVTGWLSVFYEVRPWGEGQGGHCMVAGLREWSRPHPHCR